jgi:inner membrane protein
MALLAYAPVALALVAAGHGGLAPLGGLGVLALTPVPDWDHRVPVVEHRGITHTLAFALLVGAATGGGCLLAARYVAPLRTAYGSPELLGAFGFGIGVLAILAHLAADVITPAGLEPFQPVSGRHYSLSLVGAASRIANAALLIAGVFATAVAAVFALQI